MCCSPWGCKDLDMTEQLKNNQPTIKSGQRTFTSVTWTAICLTTVVNLDSLLTSPARLVQ